MTIATSENPRPAVGSGSVERIRVITPLVPCHGCVHKAVCAIRPQLEALRFTAPLSPDDALTVTVSAKVTCRFAKNDRSGIGPALRSSWTPERRAAQAERLRVQRERAKA